ncbi:class 1 fructose-bisphosphatase [Catenovulum maritimum]|uniref:Fructose-1,6-bisphosphatase class 1 n=1 Tax=Catenovulum maritimum TaxID=1513271 RepID=A0A0J8GVN1_9ALTE|nr:class 1 fructose-bisphosphatase [Catenovulum maritimum]KMT66802.1 fructose 1,6-bisphosphatase [Catenovulum maritimum]
MQRLIYTLKQDQVDLDLIMVIRTVLASCKEIAFRVGQGALGDVLGSTLDENIQGETQKKLDVIANQLIKNMLLTESNVAAIASEEEDDIVAGNANGKYIIAFDPLDGSSNIDINGQIGTIFTIFPAVEGLAQDDPRQFQQKGRNQLAAGYVLYGPSTMLMLTTGKGTRCFTLDKTHGGFLLTDEQVSVPAETQEFSINMANARFWYEPTSRYIDDLLLGETGVRKKRFNMRWNAAMVGDIHRVLSRGGIFMYPSDNRDPNKPAKLRLLYEAYPMAMLVENAGGRASNGTADILDLELETLHQRVPVIMGSSKEVEISTSYYT